MRARQYGLLMLCLALCLAGAVQPAEAGWTESTIVDMGDTPQPGQKELYALQAGAFENEDKAFELADALREDGFTPYVLAVRGAKGERLNFAVRLSLHETLEDAKQARERFAKKHGGDLPGLAVTLLGSVAPYDGPPLEQEKEVAEAPAKAPSLPVLEDGLYFLQVGAFIERKNALERLQLYRDKGYEPGMVRLTDASETPWIIVYVGRYETVDKAREAASTLRKKEGVDCYVNLIERGVFESRLEQE